MPSPSGPPHARVYAQESVCLLLSALSLADWTHLFFSTHRNGAATLARLLPPPVPCRPTAAPLLLIVPPLCRWCWWRWWCRYLDPGNALPVLRTTFLAVGTLVTA